MKQSLNNLDISVIILLIIFTLIKNIYNLYVLYKYNLTGENKIREVFDYRKSFPLFSIVSFITAVIYLVSSIYFLLVRKVKEILFILICFYMLLRSIGYFANVIVPDIPGISEEKENLYTYYIVLVTSIITILISIYLVKIVFF